MENWNFKTYHSPKESSEYRRQPFCDRHPPTPHTHTHIRNTLSTDLYWQQDPKSKGS